MNNYSYFVIDKKTDWVYTVVSSLELAHAYINTNNLDPNTVKIAILNKDRIKPLKGGY